MEPYKSRNEWRNTVNILDGLERRFRRYGIPNITLYLIMGQVLLFMASRSGSFDIGRALLIPELALQGEWWRLITFIFIPPITNVVFSLFFRARSSGWRSLPGSATAGHFLQVNGRRVCSYSHR